MAGIGSFMTFGKSPNLVAYVSGNEDDFFVLFVNSLSRFCMRVISKLTYVKIRCEVPYFSSLSWQNNCLIFCHNDNS